MFLFSWGRKWSTELCLKTQENCLWFLSSLPKASDESSVRDIWAGLFWGSLFSCSGLVTTILRSFQLSCVSQANCSLITKGLFFGSDIWRAISIGEPLRPCILFLPLPLLGWLCYLVIVPLTLDHRSGCCCLLVRAGTMFMQPERCYLVIVPFDVSPVEQLLLINPARGSFGSSILVWQ